MGRGMSEGRPGWGLGGLVGVRTVRATFLKYFFSFKIETSTKTEELFTFEQKLKIFRIFQLFRNFFRRPKEKENKK